MSKTDWCQGHSTHAPLIVPCSSGPPACVHTAPIAYTASTSRYTSTGAPSISTRRASYSAISLSGSTAAQSPAAETGIRIEASRQRPCADRNIGQGWVQRVAEPDAVQRVGDRTSQATTLKHCPMNAARQLLAGRFESWNALDQLLDFGHTGWN